MKKYVEVQAVKEFALGFLPDPILRMAVNAVLDNAPAVDLCPKWTPVSEGLPPMRNEREDDSVEVWEYQISDPVIALTADRETVVVHVTREERGLFWWDRNGTTYDVTHWMPTPRSPAEEQQ